MPTRILRHPMTSGCLLFLVLWSVFQLGFLSKFPQVNWDENMEVNQASNAWTTGHNVYSLYDDVYPTGFSFLKHSTPNVIRPFYDYVLGFFVGVFGIGVFQGRLFSFFCGIGAVVFVFLAGKKAANTTAGLLGAVWLSTRLIFFHGTHETRPEAFLAMGAVLCLYLLLISEKESVPAGFFCGLVSAMLPGIHTNGVAVFLPFLVFGLKDLFSASSRRQGVYWCLGAFVGGSTFLLTANIPLFLIGWKLLGGFFSYQPLSVHGLGDVWNLLAAEGSRFFLMDQLGYEPMSTAIRWVLGVDTLVLVIAIFLPYVFKDKRFETMSAVCVLVELGYALMVAHKNTNYAIVLFALAAPLVGCLLSGIYLRRFAKPIIGVVGVLSLAVFFAGAAVMVHRSQREITQQKIVQQIAEHIPAGSKVVGPQGLWLGLHQYDYRDLGALMYHRWLLNQKKDITRPLAQFRPDYLILDHHFRALYFGRLNDSTYLPYILRIPFERVAVVDGGSFYGESIEIIHLSWPAS